MNAEDLLYMISHILGIKVPGFAFVDRFQSVSQLAAADINAWTIYVKKGIPDSETYLCIAHECRHMWQSIHKKEMFEKYNQSTAVNLDDYNLQPAEIDANAFAVAVLPLLIGAKPLFKNLPDHIRQAIEKRSFEILKELQRKRL